MQSNIEKISNYFALPISYNSDKTMLAEHIISDLELVNPPLFVNLLNKVEQKNQYSGANLEQNSGQNDGQNGGKDVSGDDQDVSDSESKKHIYNHIFSPSNCLGEKMLATMPNLYTTDKEYLKDTQHILRTIKPSPSVPNFREVIDIYDEIKNDISFKDKYYFLDWEHLLFLNKCDWFMQLMSMYNLSSPVLSLFLPIIMLIIPFFVIKARGLDMDIPKYIEVLKEIIANHALGKVFTQFHEADAQQKVYLVVSAAFYVFSIYQNVLVCMRFYKNMKKIYHCLNTFFKYLNHTISQMEHFISAYFLLPSYSLFIENMKTKLIKLQTIQAKMTSIYSLDEFKLSYGCLKQIGYVMMEFYDLHDCSESYDAFMYSFGFHGYLDNLYGLQSNIASGHLNYCSFNKSSSNKRKKDEKKLDKLNKKKEKKEKKDKRAKARNNEPISDPIDGAAENDIAKKLEINPVIDKIKEEKFNSVFKGAYYPALIGGDPIKNSYDLDKHLIITGPNASGKTTLLKTTLINLLISQQFGCGCYEEANIVPYKHIHCYLNIPDTMGRDSLLQAEARRCKDIIDSVNANDDKERHFCVFDELYSGTNPEEAILSAYVVMDYLAKRKNVSTILTTHYVDLCSKLEKNDSIRNCHMKVLKHGTTNAIGGGDNFEYTYLLEGGISQVKGGIKVLIDMDYPQEILDNAKL
jgi:hypothetical protein